MFDTAVAVTVLRGVFDMLTLENFSEDNRSKVIGNSVYRYAVWRGTI